jgi:hypothetical protein
MGFFIFIEQTTGDLTLIAQTGSLRGRVRRVPLDPHQQFLLLATDPMERPEKLDPRQVRQLYEHADLSSLLDSALALVETPANTTILPAVDRRSWTLAQASLEEWRGDHLRIVRLSTSAEALLASLDSVAGRGDLDADVVAFLANLAASDLNALRRRAMDARRDALEALAAREDEQPAQEELLRLAGVAQSAEALAAEPSLPRPITSNLADLAASCETATTTMSASLTAAVLAAQYRAERAESERRILIEQGQRRLAAIAAALILPTIVVGFAGANFFAPAPGQRLWTALLTAGGSLLAAIVGVELARLITGPSRRFPEIAGYLATMVGLALVVVAILVAR